MKRKKPAPDWACKIAGEAFGYGISFAELAEEAGYTRSWLTRVLKGEPEGDTARRRIEDALERIKARIEEERKEGN